MRGRITMVTLPSLEIIPCRREDTQWLYPLLAESFGSKLNAKAPTTLDGLAEILKALDRRDHGPWEQKQMIALSSCNTAGTIRLKWKRRTPRFSAGFPPLSPLFRKFGYMRVLRVIASLQLLDYSPQAGECYIDHIAVLPFSRNQGIGRLLLQWAQHDTAQHHKFGCLTLHVAGGNQQARSLYERVGFRVKKTTRSSLSSLLLGEQEWHYMVWMNSQSDKRRTPRS